MSEPKTWGAHGGKVKRAEPRDFSTVVTTFSDIVHIRIAIKFFKQIEISVKYIEFFNL